MTTLSQKATTLLELHKPGKPVVLPTVWDAWSANLAVSAGFAALTVGSHPVSESMGKRDGEGITFAELLARISQISSAVDAPLSVDIEAGYGEDPKRLIDGLISAGAVGLNIEDTVHSEGGRLREAQEHADFVGALREASDATDVHVVINARTDLFVKKIGDESDRVDRAIARLKLAAAVGADCLYPVGFHSDADYKRLAEELPLPINAIADPTGGDLSHFASLGVGRISFGPKFQGALTAEAGRILARWS